MQGNITNNLIGDIPLIHDLFLFLFFIYMWSSQVYLQVCCSMLLECKYDTTPHSFSLERERATFIIFIAITISIAIYYRLNI
jgi:hypothetical protein